VTPDQDATPAPGSTGNGLVRFVGAGPGAADLITLRGASAIADADIVVWAASLVHPDLVARARADAEVIDSAPLSVEDLLPVYRRAAAQGLVVARVHSGDPSIYGAIQEQIERCRDLGLRVEVVPGVSSFAAAAAAVGRELTIPRVAQSVILTRLEGGRTPMPPRETIRAMAAHRTTMAIYLSAARAAKLQRELLAGGYPGDTPAVIAYRVSWPDELVLTCQLDDLTDTTRAHRLYKHTLFLVGPALASAGTRSHLYHPGHPTAYRHADPTARQELRAQTTNFAQPAPPDATPESRTTPKTGE
jgi:precorrin-4/cobalt-precorrin-4 C11-methyltransferase